MIRLLLLLLFIHVSCYAQKGSLIQEVRQLMRNDSNALFIFCRGTKSKSGMIAGQFNYQDTSCTHIGIGVFVNGKERIYQVSDEAGPGHSALQADTLESFLHGYDVYYFSIWKSAASLQARERLQAVCESYRKKKITFDAGFRLGDGDTLYCSEFCQQILKQLGYDFRPRETKLQNPFQISFLERDTLYYFPVDFFQKNKRFTKIAEGRF